MNTKYFVLSIMLLYVNSCCPTQPVPHWGQGIYQDESRCERAAWTALGCAALGVQVYGCNVGYPYCSTAAAACQNIQLLTACEQAAVGCAWCACIPELARGAFYVSYGVCEDAKTRGTFTRIRAGLVRAICKKGTA